MERTHNLWIWCPVYFLLIFYHFETLSAQTSPKIEEDEFRKFDFFPAISYAPETKLTLGVIGYYYLELSDDLIPTNLSNINFLAVYTTAKQTAVELQWDIFFPGNRWRSMGEAFFNRYPSRNYGLGNNASNLIRELGEEGAEEVLNYLRFQSDIIRFAPVFLKQISPGLYAGISAELEYIYNVKILPSKFEYVGNSSAFSTIPIESTFSGMGLQLSLDTRDYVLNPLKGHFISLSNLYYGRILGSTHSFQKIVFDARKYLNPTANHTLAIRGVLHYRSGKDAIPLRALSRVGGRNFIRGYFKGTFQNNHMAGFEMEYRFPFWNHQISDPWWKIWKRLGVVGFLGGAQVFDHQKDFRFSQFNLAAGAGLRILFNQSSRVNLRIDYAIGFNKNGGGPGKRQTGLYFFLGEAF